MSNDARNLGKESVGEEAHADSPWHAEDGQHNGDGPLWTTDTARDDGEGLATDENDGDLQTDHENVNEDEELIALQTLKDVVLVVQSSVVELIENLHPHKGIEDDGAELGVGVAREDAGAGKVQNKGDDELENSLADDHLPHVGGNEGCLLALGWAVEDFVCGRVGGEGEGCEGIHDEVHPEELDGGEHGTHFCI